MIKFVWIFVCGLPFVLTVSCGDDGGEDQNTNDTRGRGTDTQTDTGTDTKAVSDTETTGDVDALVACTDFQQASWDRIRECNSPTAAILPSNELAGSICAALCELEGKRVSKSDYDTCVTYGSTIPCDDIDIELDAGSQIPDECAFLREMGCLF